MDDIAVVVRRRLDDFRRNLPGSLRHRPPARRRASATATCSCRRLRVQRERRSLRDERIRQPSDVLAVGYAEIHSYRGRPASRHRVPPLLRRRADAGADAPDARDGQSGPPKLRVQHHSAAAARATYAEARTHLPEARRDRSLPAHRAAHGPRQARSVRRAPTWNIGARACTAKLSRTTRRRSSPPRSYWRERRS